MAFLDRELHLHEPTPRTTIQRLYTEMRSKTTRYFTRKNNSNNKDLCINQNGILNKCYVIRRKAGKRKQNEKQETKSELADVTPDTSIVTLEDRDRPGKSKARVTSTRSEETHFKSDKVNRWTGRRWRRPSTQTLTSEGRSGYVNGQSGLQDRKSPEAEGGMTRKKRVGPK